jgi:hypothetical protein
MLRALNRRLLYREDLLGIDLQEESIKLFLRWDYFLNVRRLMALPFVFTLPADSVCEFLITASAYVLMVVTRKTKELDHEKLVTVFHGSSLGSSLAIFIYGDCGSTYSSYKSY